MKAIKFVFKLLAFLVVLVVAAVLALPLWFGPVAKSVANSVVPGIVKTDFRIGHLSLNPYTARFELGGLNLGNPAGYSEKDAVKIGEVIVDADTMSLATDVIHVEEIAIRDLFVSVASGGENKVLNFTQLQYNVAGGKEKYEAAQAEKKMKAEAAKTAESGKGEAQVAKNEKPQAEKKSEKKIIIDRLEVSGLKMQLSVLPIRLPTVVLTDIGRKSGGATLEEAWQQIVDGVMKAAGVTGDQLKALGVLTGDAMKKANEAVSKATEQATKALTDATKQLDTATEKAKDVTGSVTKTAGAATDMAAGAVSGGTKAVDEGVKAVGEGAKKAMDSLKSLW